VAGARQTLVGVNTGAATATQRNDIVCLGYQATVNANNTVAIGSGASASAAGAIAIGMDSAGTSAASATADLAVLGTALTALKVGNPGGGQGAWMLGTFRAGAVGLDAANYVEVKIDGTVRKLLVAA
jgi:hypothetical protein